MAKKKHNWKSPNFDKINVSKLDEKQTMLEILNDPNKMQAVLELGRTAMNLEMNLQETTSLEDWTEKVLLLLPHNFTDKENFSEKLREFVNDYTRASSTGCPTIEGTDKSHPTLCLNRKARNQWQLVLFHVFPRQRAVSIKVKVGAGLTP